MTPARKNAACPKCGPGAIFSRVGNGVRVWWVCRNCNHATEPSAPKESPARAALRAQIAAMEMTRSA